MLVYMATVVVLISFLVGGLFSPVSYQGFCFWSLVVVVLGGVATAMAGDMVLLSLIRIRHLSSAATAAAIVHGVPALGFWTGWFVSPAWVLSPESVWGSFIFILVCILAGLYIQLEEAQQKREENRKMILRLREANPWPTYADPDRRR